MAVRVAACVTASVEENVVAKRCGVVACEGGEYVACIGVEREA